MGDIIHKDIRNIKTSPLIKHRFEGIPGHVIKIVCPMSNALLFDVG